MCRELNREPAWVGAIRLAVTQGEVTPETVIEEANLRADVIPTVEDVLATMASRDLLRQPVTAEDGSRYVIGPVLMDAVPSSGAVDQLSEQGLHRWGTPAGGPP